MIEIYLKNIENLISEGKTEVALQEFIAFFDEDFPTYELNNTEDIRKIVILQSNAFRNISQSNQKGIVSFEEHLKQLNKINNTLLECLVQLKSAETINNKDDYDDDILVRNAVETKEKFEDIELTINRNIDEYDKEDQQKLISTIKILLSINGEVTIRKIRPGSVKMTIRVPERYADELIGLVKDGVFEVHDVVDAKFAQREISFTLIQSGDLFLRDPQSTSMGRKIIETSIKMIVEIGMANFTFKKLADKIDSTEASIYRYFENKHSLLSYLMNYYWEWMYFKFSFEKGKIEKNNYGELNLLIKILQESNKIDSDNLKLDFDELKRIWAIHEVEFLYANPMLPSLGKMLYAIEELIENLNPYASDSMFKSMQIIRLFGLIEFFSDQYDKNFKGNYDVLNEIKRITDKPATNKG